MIRSGRSVLIIRGVSALDVDRQDTGQVMGVPPVAPSTCAVMYPDSPEARNT